jgi:hypothetical protein
MKRIIASVRFLLTPLLIAVAFAPRPALAAFHLMEIEQAIGGVGGNDSAQAIQLRMRTTNQNLLNPNAQLVVRDATGNNPLTIAAFPAPNLTQGACLRFLVATAAFLSKTTPAAVADYTMTPIPSSYLAAGSLTFEQIGVSPPWWRLSWGSYTGPQTVQAGATANDLDGNTNPAVAGPLPFMSSSAYKFNSACGVQHITNASDYVLTGNGAVFTNHAGTAFTVVSAATGPILPPALRFLLPAALVAVALSFLLTRRSNA